MIATGKRHIVRQGHEFDRFFTKPKGRDITVKKEARLKDTIKWMKKVIAATLPQTEMIAQRLQGAREILTCDRIWRFCFEYFQYKKDKERTEQLRTPNRAWGDRKLGIDCDCFTILIGSILTNLGIPYVMRMTRYKELDFEHIYPVAITNEGEIIIDAVVHQFNYEVPYTEKEDVEMELQVLSGVQQERYNEFGDKVTYENDLPIDAVDLFVDETEQELQGLEGKAERQARRQQRKTKRKAERAANKSLPLKERLKKGLQKGFNIINKANPGTMLLRAGVLASLKLNVFKVASHLRFAYWTEDEARENKMDIGKYHQLQKIREKMEKIYFGAGGKVEALKKAILNGKGNRNKMVRLHGLGSVIGAVEDQDDLHTILGDDLFYEELNGLEGLGGFGEPATIATGAAVTAASSVMGTIAGLIKKLGGLFKKGTEAAEKFKIQDNTDNADEKTRKFSLKNVFKTVATKIKERKANKQGGGVAPDDLTKNMDVDPVDEVMMQPEMDDMDLTVPTKSQVIPNGADNESTDDESGADDDDKKKGGMVQWIKDNPVKTALIGVGTVAAVGTTIYLIKKKKANASGSKTAKKKTALAGAPKSTRKRKKSVKRGKGKKRSTARRPTKSKSRSTASKARKRNSRSIPKVELL